jgi:hypothetical protein
VRFASHDLIAGDHIFDIRMNRRRRKAVDRGQKWRQQQGDQQQTRGSNFATTKWHYWKVNFMWTEWVYDEAGGRRILYSKLSSMSRAAKRYFKETRHGGGMAPAQLESHRKFMRARAAHQALLQSVDTEFHRQRALQRAKHHRRKNPIIKRNPIKVERHLEIPRTAKPPPTIPTPIQLKRIPQKEPRENNKAIPIDTKPIMQQRPTDSSPQQETTPPRFWKHDTRRVRDLLTSQSPSLLPLPWQHHAWTAPAHRKTLRQQPFLS